MDSMLRYYNLLERVYDFVDPSFELDPERIVNRALWGTDYDPSDVSFKSLNMDNLKEGYKDGKRSNI